MDHTRERHIQDETEYVMPHRPKGEKTICIAVSAAKPRIKFVSALTSFSNFRIERGFEGDLVFYREFLTQPFSRSWPVPNPQPSRLP